MKVFWTEGAAEDLREIVGYIGRSSENAGRRVARTIYERTTTLATFPHIGRKRTREDVYELVCVPWPYIVVYEIIDDAIFIEGVVHTSRDRR